MNDINLTTIIVAVISGGLAYLGSKTTSKSSLEKTNVENANTLFEKYQKLNDDLQKKIDKYQELNDDLQRKVDKLEQDIETIKNKYEKEIRYYESEVERLTKENKQLKESIETLKKEVEDYGSINRSIG